MTLFLLERSVIVSIVNFCAESAIQSGEVVTAHDTRWGERSDCSVLYPSEGGNLHAFHALSPCAFFDIISPPYRSVCWFLSTFAVFVVCILNII